MAIVGSIDVVASAEDRMPDVVTVSVDVGSSDVAASVDDRMADEVSASVDVGSIDVTASVEVGSIGVSAPMDSRMGVVVTT